MKVNLDCIPCFMAQALKASRMACSDEHIHSQVLKETATLLADIDYSKTPPEIAHEVHKIIRDATGNPDPYLELKRHDNRIALDMYPWLKKHVNESEDRLYAAVKLAAAGNIIDYAVNHEFDVKETVEEALGKEFAIDDYLTFREDIQNADDIVYLADNAGEIVFDRVLIEELGGKDVTLVVKGGPIINDAMQEDVEAAGLSDLVKVDCIGNGVEGTGPERCDPGFLKRLGGADLVISKGQGNYEGLNSQKCIYFVLMAKCPLIAGNLGVNKGDIVFCKGQK